LLTGTVGALADFEMHATTNLPHAAQRIIGVQTMKRPAEKRPSMFARWHFTNPAVDAELA